MSTFERDISETTLFSCIICEGVFEFDTLYLAKRHLIEQHSGFGWRCRCCKGIFNRATSIHKCNRNGQRTEMDIVRRSDMKTGSDIHKQYNQFLVDNLNKIERKRKCKSETQQKENRSRSHKKSEKRKREKSISVLGEKNQNSTTSDHDKQDVRNVIVKETETTEKKEKQTKEQKTYETEENKVVRSVTSTTLYERDENVEIIGKKRSWNRERRNKVPIISSDEESDNETTRAVETIQKEMERENSELQDGNEGEIEEMEEPVVHLEEPERPGTPDEQGAVCEMNDQEMEDPEIEEINKNDNTKTQKETCEKQIENDKTENYAVKTKTENYYAYVPTPVVNRAIKLNRLREIQQKRIVLNVGGKYFEVATQTIFNDPTSLLADMISKESRVIPYKKDGVYSYFVCRNPKHFDLILRYLRNGCKLNIEDLPTSLFVLREIQEDAAYYELNHLELLVKKKILEEMQKNLNQY